MLVVSVEGLVDVAARRFVLDEDAVFLGSDEDADQVF
jgi:hypothetical protein